LSPSRLRTWFREDRAQTGPEHPDPSLRGRTYAIPFARVWAAAAELASARLKGWSLVEADEGRGVLMAESTRPLFRVVDDVRITVSLDENGQTRVDMVSASRTARGDLGRNARRVERFFLALDRKLGAGPGTILDPTLSMFRHALPLAVVLATACSPAGDVPQDTGEAGEVPLAIDRDFQVRSYERNLVFLGSRGDTTTLALWSFTARTGSGGVDREVRGWLAWGDTWEPLFTERWEGPPSRVPWRILPRGPVRLIVGRQDALEAILFQGGGRSLEVASGALLVEWSGQQGQNYRVHEGTLFLADRSLDGIFLDMTRSWASDDGPAGDFGFLVSGNSLQMVFEDLAPEGETQGGDYSCWARVLFADRQWRGVRLVWREVRAFEPARRDVPVEWGVRSPDGTLGGELAAATFSLEAGEGEDPVLPVSGLFRLTGTLVLDGRDFPVEGFLQHRQR
jgi:hypothetical protein